MAMCKVSSSVHFVTRSAGGREGSARAHWVPNTDRWWRRASTSVISARLDTDISDAVSEGPGRAPTYNHTEHTVLAETRPTSSVCVVSVSEEGLAH